MLKLTIKITEKDKDTSMVEIVVPKDLGKATKGERQVGAMVKEKIVNVLNSMN